MYSPQRGDVSEKKLAVRHLVQYSPQRGDVSFNGEQRDPTDRYSPQRGDVSLQDSVTVEHGDVFPTTWGCFQVMYVRLALNWVFPTTWGCFFDHSPRR